MVNNWYRWLVYGQWPEQQDTQPLNQAHIHTHTLCMMIINKEEKKKKHAHTQRHEQLEMSIYCMIELCYVRSTFYGLNRIFKIFHYFLQKIKLIQKKFVLEHNFISLLLLPSPSLLLLTMMIQWHANHSFFVSRYTTVFILLSHFMIILFSAIES